MSDSFVRKSGKWIVPPPPRKHRCIFPGPAQTFSKGVVWACHCGDAWTNDPRAYTAYPTSGWTRAREHDLEADDE